jgi:hypothetical protein
VDASRRGRARRLGFTVLEVLIASSAMLVALLGFSQAMIAAMRAEALTREQNRATEGARAMLEELRNGDFRDLFRQFNALAADDLAGPGTAPGPNFAVPGLAPVVGDPDGLVGEIVFPVDPGAPGLLREDLLLPELGSPLDMNADGASDANDHSADYLLLPVLVRVRWRGPAGTTQVELHTWLAEAL